MKRVVAYDSNCKVIPNVFAKMEYRQWKEASLARAEVVYWKTWAESGLDKKKSEMIFDSLMKWDLWASGAITTLLINKSPELIHHFVYLDLTGTVFDSTPHVLQWWLRNHETLIRRINMNKCSCLHMPWRPSVFTRQGTQSVRGELLRWMGRQKKPSMCSSMLYGILALDTTTEWMDYFNPDDHCRPGQKPKFPHQMLHL